MRELQRVGPVAKLVRQLPLLRTTFAAGVDSARIVEAHVGAASDVLGLQILHHIANNLIWPSAVHTNG